MIGSTGPTRRLAIAAAAAVSLLAASCRPSVPADFGADGPMFEPERFFAGRTESWGVIEGRGGAPRGRLRTETSGRLDGAILVVDQTLRFDDGETRDRSWRLARRGEHAYLVTATDIVGEGSAERYGRAFKMVYDLQLMPGSRWRTVHASQWLYLMDDGATVLSRLTLSKLGVTVATVSEIFRRSP